MDSSHRYRQVAALHAANIDRGFLSTLGQPFLALVYRAIDEAPDGVLIVEEREGHVLGFVAGSVGMGAIYRRLLHRPLPLASALAPSLFSPARLRRIFEILRYGRGDSGGARWPAPELLSIAVAPEARGQGIADALYRCLVESFRSRGIEAFRIVVGDALGPAHRFYQRMGATPAGRIEVHEGEGSRVYVQSISS
jgi:ribosomal protein S18 acetylase RimI-like enzyme